MRVKFSKRIQEFFREGRRAMSYPHKTTLKRTIRVGEYGIKLNGIIRCRTLEIRYAA